MFVNICHSIESQTRNHHQEHSLGVPGVNTNTLSGWLEEYQSCWSYLVVSILQASQDGIDQSGEIVVFNLLLSHTLSGIFTRCHIKKLAGVSRSVSQCLLSD